jgi:hypothetical protein
MSRGPATFRQRDLTAAVKAMRAAGCEVVRVEIGKDGKIIVVTGTGAVKASEAADNFFDEKMKHDQNGNSEPSSV